MTLHGGLLLVSGFYCGLGVVLGAFAAHALKTKLPVNLLSAFETGVHYQFIHGLALMGIVILAKQFPHGMWQWSGVAITIGVLLFSGSLYMLALTGIKWFGPITPIGGLAFIVGWILFLMAVVKSGALS